MGPVLCHVYVSYTQADLDAQDKKIAEERALVAEETSKLEALRAEVEEKQAALTSAKASQVRRISGITAHASCDSPTWLPAYTAWQAC